MDDQRKLKILMLEDNLDDAMLIERILQKDKLAFLGKCVDGREEFNEAIARFQPDVVLSDHGLPSFNSAEALKICLKERPAMPFILVTGTVSDDYAINCLRNGADDYVLKSNLSRLPIAIRSAIKKRKLEKLKREARHALRKQNKELSKLNHELDSFVYSVSHNLRGPVASAIGLINLARTEKDFGELSLILRMIDSSLANLDKTLNEILSFARNARNDIQLGEVDWKHLVNDTLTKLDYLDRSNAILKLIDLDFNIPFFSDGSRIGTILLNLVANAMIYRNDDKESIVSIEVKTSDKEAIIVIKDNGIGIPENIIPKVFDMFYRGNDKSKGAGLGLYITKEIINKLNGSITLVSNHQGTVVIVTIPNMRLCELN